MTEALRENIYVQIVVTLWTDRWQHWANLTRGKYFQTNCVYTQTHRSLARTFCESVWRGWGGVCQTESRNLSTSSWQCVKSTVNRPSGGSVRRRGRLTEEEGSLDFNIPLFHLSHRPSAPELPLSDSLYFKVTDSISPVLSLKSVIKHYLYCKISGKISGLKGLVLHFVSLIKQQTCQNLSRGTN